MDLKTAMRNIRADETKHSKFVKDPAGTLKAMGVDVSKTRIVKTQHVPTGSTHGVCGSGGCGVCVSAG